MNTAAPTPVPINDIIGPIWVFPYPPWLVATAVVLALAIVALLAALVRAIIKRKKKPTDREIALAALDRLRQFISGADAYEFGVKVSDAIRAYIHARHGLAATTQTSLEFLDTIRDNPVFTANEKAGLAVFLERTDLLKFARAEAGESDLIALVETAERLVRGEVQPGQKAEGGGGKP